MEKKEAAEKAPVDPLTAPIGDLGRWQVWVCLFVFLCKFGTGWHTLAIIFLAAPIDYECSDPDNSTDRCSPECHQVEFDRSVFEENIISEWGLICEDAYLASLSQSIVMFGIMLGGVAFGMLSDRFGRRPAFLSCCFLQLVAGCIVSASPYFWFFCVFRFLTAFATGGTMTTSFVIIMEIVGRSKREFMSIIYQLPFNFGHASLPLFSYLIRHWRWFHLSFSAFSLVFVSYIWTVPETPRWLFTTGQVDRAADLLEKAAAMNRLPTERIRADLEEAHRRKTAGAPPKKGTMLDLFRYPNLRMKTLVMGFNWLVVCLTYYGVSQYVSQMGGDIYLNVAFGACLGMVGTLICIPATKYIGRKYTLIASSAVSGVSLLGIAMMPSPIGLPHIVLASVGIFGASVTFPNAYLYAGELFPTVVRNSGMGFSSLVGRGGSMGAPFVTDLGKIAEWIPPVVFGGFSVAAALSVFLLPETKGAQLPETIEDGEQFGKKKPPATT